MTARLAAIAMLTSALAAQVANPVTAHVSRGVAAREAGRLQEARRELEAAVRAAPGIAEAHLYLGLVLHESEDFAAAADSLDRALALNPAIPGARELLGYDLLMLSRAAEAVPHLDAARRENPGNWQVAAWLGRARLEAGDPGAALPHLLEAQGAAPADPELLYLVGKAYSQLAIHAQMQLLASAPESSHAHLAIAEDHDFNGRPDEAIAAYRKALASNKALPDAWRALGDLEQDRGRYRDAVDAYRRALEIQTENVALHFRCGEALLALGACRPGATAPGNCRPGRSGAASGACGAWQGPAGPRAVRGGADHPVAGARKLARRAAEDGNSLPAGPGQSQARRGRGGAKAPAGVSHPARQADGQ